MRLFTMMFVLLLGLKIVALMSESIKYNLVMIREKTIIARIALFWYKRVGLAGGYK